MKVGLLWRHEWDPPSAGPPRLQGMFDAFAELGVAAQAVVYSDAAADEVRARLAGLDGVLVWVNPIEQGLDRSLLDEVLRDAGIWVSAHPDVISRMATKRVLVDTRELGWGSDTRLLEEVPTSAPGPVVWKQLRGMGGQGVWKVEGTRVEEAATGEVELVEDLPARFAAHLPLVEQPFEPRIAEGMIRAYLTHDRVVGFAHQFPRGLRPAAAGEPPTGKTFLPETAFPELRALLETEWVPGLQRLVGVATHELPVIWDADFIRGEEKPYVLCEINASSTFAFPEHAMPGVARAALARLR